MRSQDSILKSAIVMFEIPSYETSMEAFILADRFKIMSNIQVPYVLIRFLGILYMESILCFSLIFFPYKSPGNRFIDKFLSNL